MTFTLTETGPDEAGLTAPADVLDADFYAFQDLLTDAEQRALREIRGFLETEVRPHADDHWDRA